MKRDNAGPVRSINDVTRIAMDKLGGRASIADIVEQLRDIASYREWTAWSDRNIASQVRGALRSAKSTKGLPEHYEIGGQYVALSLFTVEEFESKAVKLAALSKANKSKVYALAEACNDIHGRTFDADKVIARAS